MAPNVVLHRDARGGKHGLVTGSADGKIQFWTASLEMAVRLDIDVLGPLSRMIHSLSWDSINHKVCCPCLREGIMIAALRRM